VAVGSADSQGLPGRAHSFGRGLDRHRRRYGRPRLHCPLRRRRDEGALLPVAGVVRRLAAHRHSLVCLASGVVLGLGIKWGLIRYWWVAVKLALNVLLVALVPVALRPEVIEKAEQARRFVAGEPASLAVVDLIFPPIVSRAYCSSPSCWRCSSRGA
jgi:hypothetical protein